MTDPCEGCTRERQGCRGICVERKRFLREACPPPRANWRATAFTIDNELKIQKQKQKLKRR